jgi:hypothetical protein
VRDVSPDIRLHDNARQAHHMPQRAKPFRDELGRTEVVSLETFFQLTLCLTRAKDQQRVCLTNTRNDRIVVDIELSRKLSLAAIICRNLLCFIGPL